MGHLALLGIQGKHINSKFFSLWEIKVKTKKKNKYITRLTSLNCLMSFSGAGFRLICISSLFNPMNIIETVPLLCQAYCFFAFF